MLVCGWGCAGAGPKPMGCARQRQAACVKWASHDIKCAAAGWKLPLRASEQLGAISPCLPVVLDELIMDKTPLPLLATVSGTSSLCSWTMCIDAHLTSSGLPGIPSASAAEIIPRAFCSGARAFWAAAFVLRESHTLMKSSGRRKGPSPDSHEAVSRIPSRPARHIVPWQDFSGSAG